MDTVFVKPKNGARIRQPERNGAVMPDGGATVPRDGYYERLIISGDVVVSEEPVAKRSPYPEPDAQDEIAAPQPPDRDTRR